MGEWAVGKGRWSWRWLAVAAALVVAGAGAEPDRPKIGLVLSGGGARGFAHLGVLEWFEAHRIPIDFLAGTSMGGLVAGLYASGLTTAEMRDMGRRVEWLEFFKDAPPYAQLSWQRKEDQQAFPNGLELGLRHGVSLPGGVVQGQKAGLLLSRVTLPVSDITEFGKLPVPFRCVATDMLKAEPVVLSSGSLADALRATTAVPGVFAPVEIGGKVLADGGLLNNVPTDVVKQMGADVVIAVDIGTPLGDKESLQNLLGMVNQSFSVMIIQNVRANLRLADIILSPDLEGFSSASFRSADAMADRGYKAAEAKQRILAPLALDEAAWARHLAERRARRPGGQVTPSFLDIRGGSDLTREEIERRFGLMLGKPLDADKVEAELARLYGEGYYARLGYRPFTRDGRTGLMIGLSEKRYGPPYLRVGIDFHGGTADETRFTLAGRVTGTNLTGYGSEWRGDLTVGERTVVAAEYHQPLGGGMLFVAPRAWYRSRATDLYAGDARQAEYLSREVAAGLDLGVQPIPEARLRAGLAYGGVDQHISFGVPLRPRVEEPFGYFRAQATVDTRDRVTLPSRGLRFDGEARWYTAALGSQSSFTWLHGELQLFQPAFAGTVFVLGDVGTSLDGSPPYGEFTLGGLARLSAYRRDRFRGSHALYGGLGYLRPLFDLPLFLGGKVYGTGMVETGTAAARLDDAKFFSSGTLGFAADTIFGPAFLGISYGEAGAGQVQFSVGKLF